jgi:hypothetical protein
MTNSFVCDVHSADTTVETMRDVSSGCDEKLCLIGISEVECDGVDTGYNANAVAGAFACALQWGPTEVFALDADQSNITGL